MSDLGCVHMLTYNASVRRRLRALWSYNELGLTNHSAFLNVANLQLPFAFILSLVHFSFYELASSKDGQILNRLPESRYFPLHLVSKPFRHKVCRRYHVP